MSRRKGRRQRVAFHLHEARKPSAIPNYFVLVEVKASTARGGTSRSHISSIMPARLADRVWWTNFQSSLKNIYVRLSGQISVHNALKYGTKPIRYVTLHFRDRRCAASLPHKNCAAQSTVNRRPFRYDFHGGANAIRYGINTAYGLMSLVWKQSERWSIISLSYILTSLSDTKN